MKEPKSVENKKCSSCKIGFNSKSDPLKCDGCDSFTHKKLACIKEGSNNAQLYYKLCNPENLIGKNAEKDTDSQPKTNIIKVDQGFKCGICKMISKSKFSVKRHFEWNHSEKETEEMESQLPDMVEINVAEQAQHKDLSRIQTKGVSSLDDILKSVAFQEYAGVFKKENIDV